MGDSLIIEAQSLYVKYLSLFDKYRQHKDFFNRIVNFYKILLVKRDICKIINSSQCEELFKILLTIFNGKEINVRDEEFIIFKSKNNHIINMVLEEYITEDRELSVSAKFTRFAADLEIGDTIIIDLAIGPTYRDPRDISCEVVLKVKKFDRDERYIFNLENLKSQDLYDLILALVREASIGVLFYNEEEIEG